MRKKKSQTFIKGGGGIKKLFLVLITLALIVPNSVSAQPAIPCSWQTLAPIAPFPGSFAGIEGAAAGIIGDKLYVSHGFGPSAGGGDGMTLWIYDIPSDTWSQGPTASFNRSETIGAVTGGLYYVIGGRTFSNTQIVEIFDPIANTWSQGANMPTGRGGAGAAVVNGLIHVIGGRPGGSPGSGPPLAAHEVYNPVADSWATAAPLPTPVLDNYATVEYNGKIYVIGGQSPGFSFLGAVQIYDPITDTWSIGAPMTTPRSNAAAGVVNGLIAVVGGVDSTFVNQNNTEFYNPHTDTWTTGPSKPTASSEFSVGLNYTYDAFYLVGSGISGLASPIHEALLCDLGELEADLSIVKMDDDDPVLAGNDVEYTIIVTNNGPTLAQDVVVTDTLPAGAEELSGGMPVITGCPDIVTNSNGIVECRIGVIPANTASMPITITVTTDILCRGSIVNNVNVTSSTFDPQEVDNFTEEDTLCTVDTANLSIRKTDDADPVVAGNILTYTVTVHNEGPDPATNVRVTDTIPAGEAYVRMSAGGTGWICAGGGALPPGGILTCRHPNIPVGQNRIFTYQVTVLPETRGDLNNYVSVKSLDTFDPEDGDNETWEFTLVNAEADLEFLGKKAASTVVAGDLLTYVLSARNNGPSSAENMRIIDVLPLNTVFESVSAAGASCVTPSPGSNGTVTCTWGGMTAPRTVREVTLVVKVLSSAPDGSVIINTATTESDTTEPVKTLGNESADSKTTVLTEADLSITKTDFPFDPVVAGQDNIIYKITVTNLGLSDAQNVVALDGLPGGVTFIETSGCAGDPNNAPGGVVTCELGTIAANASKQYTIKVSVDASTVGDILNVVRVISDTKDTNSANNVTDETTEVLSKADVSITKTDNPDPVMPNNPLTYTVTVSNAGPSDALLVVVNDTLPAEVDFVSTSGCFNDPDGVPNCDLGVIPVGTSKVYTINVNVKPNTGGRVITNVARARVDAGSNDPDFSNNTATEDTDVIGASALNEQGSLLIWPLIDNNLSTIVNISNMSDDPVLLECYMVTRRTLDTVDDKRNFNISLSPKQKFWWDTSNPKTVEVSDGSDLYTTSVPGFNNRSGYMFCFAIDENEYEIIFNNLIGSGIYFDGTRSFEYNAIPLQAYEGLVGDRRLLLDGIEYSAGTSTIMFEGFTANAFGIIQGKLAVADIDFDLVLSRQPEFNINFDCYNENEMHFSSHVHYKDFELYDLGNDLHLATWDLGNADAFQCTAVAEDWRDPFSGQRIARGALWAVFYETATIGGRLMYGGNVWHPIEGSAPLSRSCARLRGRTSLSEVLLSA